VGIVIVSYLIDLKGHVIVIATKQFQTKVQGERKLNKFVKCSRCEKNILIHTRVGLVSCSSYLSGEIEVYRNKIEKEKEK